MNTAHTTHTILASLLCLTCVACGAGSVSVEGDTVTETRVLEAPDGALLTVLAKYPVEMLGDPKTEIIDRLVIRLPSSGSSQTIHPSLRPASMQFELQGEDVEGYQLSARNPEPRKPFNRRDEVSQRASRPGPSLAAP